MGFGFQNFSSSSSGPSGDFLSLSGGTMETDAEIAFDNGSRIRQSPGGNGIDQICSIDYVHRWRNGLLYLLDQSNQIRVVLYGFNFIPDSSYDSTQGYIVGSLFLQQNGVTYICTDNTENTAVWELVNVGGGVVPLTYAGTLTPDCNDGLSRSIVMTGDCEIAAPINGAKGINLRLEIRASGGSQELTFTGVVTPVGATYEAAVANGNYRIVELEYNGDFWMMVRNLEFSD